MAGPAGRQVLSGRRRGEAKLEKREKSEEDLADKPPVLCGPLAWLLARPGWRTDQRWIGGRRRRWDGLKAGLQDRGDWL